jgi:hypothetical protein
MGPSRASASTTIKPFGNRVSIFLFWKSLAGFFRISGGLTLAEVPAIACALVGK